MLNRISVSFSRFDTRCEEPGRRRRRIRFESRWATSFVSVCHVVACGRAQRGVREAAVGRGCPSLLLKCVCDICTCDGTGPRRWSRFRLFTASREHGAKSCSNRSRPFGPNFALLRGVGKNKPLSLITADNLWLPPEVQLYVPEINTRILSPGNYWTPVLGQQDFRLGGRLVERFLDSTRQ